LKESQINRKVQFTEKVKDEYKLFKKQQIN